MAMARRPVPALVLLVLVLAVAILGIRAEEDLYRLNLVHFNDFHARFEETSPQSTKCVPEQQQCIGGFARLYTLVKELKREFPDAVVLNAGDSFQGTLWYNLLRWNVTQHFMNLLPLDAHTLGNHEFDHDVAGVVPYLKTINATMVVCNINDTREPSIQGLYEKSIVIERKGRKIGIVGVILQTTDELAMTGNLTFTDEVDGVKKEADRLAAQGVDIVIVLSHSGLNVDKIIAEKAGTNIDIIVGGHTHSLLYTGETPSNEIPVDNYPVVVTQDTGNKVLVVQASAYTKYLGNLTISFDKDGRVVEWEGKPIYLDNSVIQDEGILRELEPYKQQVDALGKRQLGINKVTLSRRTCGSTECNLGNFVMDVFVDYFTSMANDKRWTYAAVAITNQGGLRTDIPKGVITYEDVKISQPFDNIVTTFDLKGKYLLQALEYSVGANYTGGGFYSNLMIQVSGLKITYDVRMPVGNRVVSALIRCSVCKLPKYTQIQPETAYKIAAPSFIADGGDGFKMISENRENTERWSAVDIDIIEKYILKQKMITHGIEGRITVLT